MALKSPNVWDASYQHPAYYDRSAVRLVVYLFRRPDDKNSASANSSWNTLPNERRLGDAKGFIRAANARTKELREDARRRGKNFAKNKAPWCCSYIHLVMSPSSRARLPVSLHQIPHLHRHPVVDFRLAHAFLLDPAFDHALSFRFSIYTPQPTM